jgi:hypothetical protein
MFVIVFITVEAQKLTANRLNYGTATGAYLPLFCVTVER